MAYFIQLKQVTKRFSEKAFFENLSLTITAKTRLALIGPNGAGKSTLFSLIAQRDDCDSGEIHWQKNLKIQSIRQESVAISNLTAMEWLQSNNGLSQLGWGIF